MIPRLSAVPTRSDSITVFPALEIIFESTDVLTEKLQALSKAARGKKIDAIRKNISRDIETVQAGITLTNLDKYYCLAYEETATVFDYFDGGVTVICEYANCIEKGRAALSQLSEDIKLLYEDGILFKRLDGFFIDLAQHSQKCWAARLYFLIRSCVQTTI